MSTLRNAISDLAAEFAAGVLSVIRGASLADILKETRGGSAPNGARSAPAEGRGPAKSGRRGRLPRRSASDIGALVERIVALLEATPNGLRAEEIREKLGLEAKELQRPIAEALTAKRIAKQGEKRATTYFARSAAPKAKAAATNASAKSAKSAKKAQRKQAQRKKTQRKKAQAAPEKSTGAKKGAVAKNGATKASAEPKAAAEPEAPSPPSAPPPPPPDVDAAAEA